MNKKRVKSNLEIEYEKALRAKSCSEKTINTYSSLFIRYVHWLKEQHGRWVHPESVGAECVTKFLSQMANRFGYSASTQNTTLAALLFYYNTMLRRDLQGIDAVRSKKPKRLPVCASRKDFAAMLPHLSGVSRLVAMIQFGSGLRIGEAVAYCGGFVSFV